MKVDNLARLTIILSISLYSLFSSAETTKQTGLKPFYKMMSTMNIKLIQKCAKQMHKLCPSSSLDKKCLKSAFLKMDSRCKQEIEKQKKFLLKKFSFSKCVENISRKCKDVIKNPKCLIRELKKSQNKKCAFLLNLK